MSAEGKMSRSKMSEILNNPEKQNVSSLISYLYNRGLDNNIILYRKNSIISNGKINKKKLVEIVKASKGKRAITINRLVNEGLNTKKQEKKNTTMSKNVKIVNDAFVRTMENEYKNKILAIKDNIPYSPPDAGKWIRFDKPILSDFYRNKFTNEEKKALNIVKFMQPSWVYFIKVLSKLRITPDNMILVQPYRIEREKKMVNMKAVETTKIKKMGGISSLTQNNLEYKLEALRDNLIDRRILGKDSETWLHEEEADFIKIFIVKDRNDRVRKQKKKLPKLVNKKQQKKPTRQLKQRRKGEYFNYYHNLPIDLSKYQIYKKGQTIQKEPCLIYCMRQQGIAENVIKMAKQHIKIDCIPIDNIAKIMDYLDMSIKIIIDTKDKEETIKFGKDNAKNGHINICCMHYHYFTYDDTNITYFALQNIDELKDIPDFNRIIKKKIINGKTYYERKDNFIKSNKLVKYLLQNKNKHLTKINKLEAEETFEDYKIDEANEKDFKDVKFRNKKNVLNYDIIAFDFETTTNGEFHESYLCSAQKLRYDSDTDKFNIILKRSFYGKNAGKKLLEIVTNDSILLAHNIKYDLRFLVKYIYNYRPMEKEGKVLGGSARYKKYNLLIRDSYLMTNMKLSKFNETFFSKDTINKYPNIFPKNESIDIKKEIMPYEIYNTKTMNMTSLPVSLALEYIKNDNQKKEFINNINNLNIKFEKDGAQYFDHIAYAKFYCDQDVNTMVKGYLVFREWIKEVSGLDILNYVTISSIAQDIMIKKGCYDDVKYIRGPIRKFIMKCVVGGRTMMRDNEKQHITNKKINAIDARSLYPSAVNRMGFLKGEAKLLHQFAYDEIKNYDGYFVKINVKEIGKKLHMPLLSTANEFTGARDFTNESIGIHYVDKVGLEDLINYQNIDFEIIEGYYYDEGRNYKCKDVIKELFNERLRLIEEKNPIQETYKLILNSIYGKTILKDMKTINIYKDDEDSMLDYVYRNADYIKDYQQLHGSNKYLIKVFNIVDDLFTLPQVGVETLSMSKRIMNEVITLAEELDIEIYYQATDSMHIDDSKLDLLQKEYYKKYNRELLGNQLGQFHSDFKLSDKTKQADGKILATESYFVGKGVYVDKLEYQMNGITHNDYHVRMKGINAKSLEEKVKTEYDGDYIKLYKDLYNNKNIEFDMLVDTVKFTFNSNYSVSTVNEFKRNICFKN